MSERWDEAVERAMRDAPAPIRAAWLRLKFAETEAVRKGAGAIKAIEAAGHQAMSERKRWADDQIKTMWDSERLGGPTAEPGTLEADHLQAREDVKRLADLGRRVVDSAHDSPEAAHCPRCLAENALAVLLAEVDPK